MTPILLQMALIIACGSVWRTLQPAGLNAQQTRIVTTSVVYYLFLPAMVLEVLWRADIGLQSLQYTLLGIASTAFGIFCSWLCSRLFKFSAVQTGTVLLAASFANVTFLGLPVLEQTFGAWTRSVVIQIDLFAIAPFLYTFGIMLSRHYGSAEHERPKSPVAFLNTPPFWAAFIAVMLNLNHVPIPPWFAAVLQKLSAAVIPLMLFSLGLALSWQAVHLKQLPFVLTTVLIKLLLLPLFAYQLAAHLDLAPDYRAAAVMDLAMPSMLMGVVFCDRYHLDSGLYAMLVSVTTALSLLTLPFWYQLL